MKKLSFIFIIVCILISGMHVMAEEENLSIGAKVTSSIWQSPHAASRAIDGYLDTIWNAFYQQENPPWISFELEGLSEINRIVIYEYFSSTNSYYDNIQYSEDGENWFDFPKTLSRTIYSESNPLLYTKSNGSPGEFLGRRRVYTCNNSEGMVLARQIRLTSTPDKNVHISEFEIYGKYLNTYLKELTLSEGILEPGFDKDVLSYACTIESLEDIPEVNAVAEDEAGVQVDITEPSPGNPTATIKVTAKHGISLTYTIEFVVLEINSELFDLSVSNGVLIPDFNKDITSYEVALNEDDEFPEIFATPLSYMANVNVIPPPENGTQAIVRVEAADKSSVIDYTINYIRTSAKLSSLTAEGYEFSTAFDPDIVEYILLWEDEGSLPQISASAKYEGVEVSIQQAKLDNLQAVVEVVSLTGEKRTYTIYIEIQSSSETDAELSKLSLLSGGSFNEEFKPETTEYHVFFEGGDLPQIVASTKSSKATMVIEQANPKNKVAEILVTSGDKSVSKTYKVYFLENIALGRNAYCSSNYAGAPATNAFDGDMGTRWQASNGAIPEWAVVDLEGHSKVFDIALYQNFSSSTAYWNRVFRSDDGFEWTEVPVTVTRTQLNPDDYGLDPSKLFYKLIYSFGPFEARYVQIKGTSGARHAVQEIEMFGVREPAVSANSALKELSVSEGTLTPKFNKYITSYKIKLGENDPIPSVSALAEDDYAVVIIEQANDATMVARVIVTAENGQSKAVYTINMERDVPPEKNANLSSIFLSKGILYPEFFAGTSNYTVFMPEDDEIPVITASPEVSGASVSIAQATKESKRATVIVLAKDGQTVREYTIDIRHGSVELSALSVEAGSLSPEFSPGVIQYTVMLEPGEETPEVHAEAEDENSLIYIMKEPMRTLIRVTTFGKEISKEYYKCIISCGLKR